MDQREILQSSNECEENVLKMELVNQVMQKIARFQALYE